MPNVFIYVTWMFNRIIPGQWVGSFQEINVHMEKRNY